MSPAFARPDQNQGTARACVTESVTIGGVRLQALGRHYIAHSAMPPPPPPPPPGRGGRGAGMTRVRDGIKKNGILGRHRLSQAAHEIG